MFDIVNAYLFKIYPTGLECDEAVEYIQEHRNDEEVNADYELLR